MRDSVKRCTFILCIFFLFGLLVSREAFGVTVEVDNQQCTPEPQNHSCSNAKSNADSEIHIFGAKVIIKFFAAFGAVVLMIRHMSPKPREEPTKKPQSSEDEPQRANDCKDVVDKMSPKPREEPTKKPQSAEDEPQRANDCKEVVDKSVKEQKEFITTIPRDRVSSVCESPPMVVLTEANLAMHHQLVGHMPTLLTAERLSQHEQASGADVSIPGTPKCFSEFMHRPISGVHTRSEEA